MVAQQETVKMEFLKTFLTVEKIDCSEAKFFGQATEPLIIDFDENTETSIRKSDFQDMFSSSLKACPVTNFALALEVDSAASLSLLNETIKMSNSSFEINFNFAKLYAQDSANIQFYIVAMPSYKNKASIPVNLNSLRPEANETE